MISVSERDIWGYLVKKKWKKDKEVILNCLKLYKNSFFKSWGLYELQTVETLKDASFSLENEEDRLKLLK